MIIKWGFNEIEIDIDDKFNDYDTLQAVEDFDDNWKNYCDDPEEIAEIANSNHHTWRITRIADLGTNYPSQERIDEEIGYYWIEIDNPFKGNKLLESYFDYEAFGRDVRLEQDGEYWTSNGVLWLLERA